MSDDQPSIFRRLYDRVFPKAPDFFTLMAEQCVQVGHTANLLVEFMETGDMQVGKDIKKDEHLADEVKIRNIHTLNEAFSTPIDREDIYRTINDLDEIVNFCKSTVSEMDVLGVTPDKHTLEMAIRLKEGVAALINGFTRLQRQPLAAADDADLARKAERRVEKIYRRALADLFVGEDHINMFKRREIYRHLANAADRMAHCANTLHDIVVKMV
ncbi:MAG: DUF47 family protein [Rhodospirillales bacterium]|nr:DUF47 family protein [Rhodospirillales bacterium]